MKKCGKCRVLKNLDQFHNSSRTKDRLTSTCKECKGKLCDAYRENKRMEKRKLQQIPDLNNEIWKNIRGYEDVYCISNLGRIKNVSLYRCRQPLLNQSIKNGYRFVTLAGYGKQSNKSYYVHRLVADAFIPNPENLPVVHHKDHNRLNNNLDNLIWSTHRDNIKAASDAGKLVRKDCVNKPLKVIKEEFIPKYYTDDTFIPQDEIWIKIEGYKNMYIISNYGRVKSFHRNVKGQLLKPRLHLCRKANKPLSYNLSDSKIDKSITVHRLVALYFIPNPNNLPEINHIDGNKHNNHISNLEWSTHADNIKHAVENGLTNKGEKSFLSKLKEHEVIEIRRLKTELNYSNIKLSKMFKVTPSTIRYIIIRKTWKHI